MDIHPFEDDLSCFAAIDPRTQHSIRGSACSRGYDEQVHVLVRQPAGELFAEVSALLQRPEEEDEEVEVKEDVHEVVAETSTHAGQAKVL